jgi:LPS O-antigen subunit length determinant protein (WzzB/FepE family)
MTKKEDADQITNHPVYVIAQPTESNDEIDLTELLNSVKKRKKFLIAWCFAITLVALVLALMMPRKYKGEASFYPPTESDLSALNMNDIYAVKPIEVYTILTQYIKSDNIRKEVFNDIYVKSLKESKGDPNQLFDTFKKKISFKQSQINKKSISNATDSILDFLDTQKEIVAPVVNQIIKSAVLKTKKKLITKQKIFIDYNRKRISRQIEIMREKAKNERLDKIARLEAENHLQITNLKNKIRAEREMEKKKLEDQLVRMREALLVAQGASIETPEIETIDAISKLTQNSPNNHARDQLTPYALFMLGSDTLTARIDALKERKDLIAFSPTIRDYQNQMEKLKNNPQVTQLKSRKNDDPYISGLRSLESQLNALNFTTDINSFNVLSALTPAETPTRAEKSKKIIILLGGMLFSLISGIAIIVAPQFFSHKKNKQ